METKSRYEVISDLEAKKRELIKEKNSLNDVLAAKEKGRLTVERQKDDTILVLDRQLDDLAEDIEVFKKAMEEKKETITELIKSVDDSLARFGGLAASK